MASYYWEPTRLITDYDMTLLEEPAWTSECQAAIDAAIEAEPYESTMGCAFLASDVHTGVSSAFAERAPEVVDFLGKMFVGTLHLADLAAWKQGNNKEWDEAAIYYLKNNEDIWTQWVPADVAAKVKEALVRESIPETSTTLTPTPLPTPTPSLLTAGDRTFKQYPQPPLMTIDPAAGYTAIISTNKGVITLELFASEAPITVNNFVFLVEEGFYKGIIFHRVIPDFMIQGGDPTGTGSGGPGYRFEDEIDSSLVFDGAGILAMANAGPNTNGSQFFITTLPQPHLNGRHTIFGRVLQGQEVAEAISRVHTNRNDRPTDQVIIDTIEIITTGVQ